ncbi:MAG TPA: glycosyltransferase family 4 protein [Armatimonadota bacterium]|nr:glycosyltransferase family 4 protein [Armatimonadota bacterium]
MFRILYVDAAPFPGGAQQSLAGLIEELDKAAWEPWLAGPPLIARMAPSACWIPLCLPVSSARSRGPAGAAFLVGQTVIAGARLALAALNARPAIIHANGRAAWIPARIAATCLHVPLIWHARDLAGSERFDGVAAAFSHRCIAPSDAVVRRLQDSARSWRFLPGHPDRPVSMIPNGIDLTRFRPADSIAARRSLTLPTDGIIAGMIGQWVPWKGVEHFLAAAKEAAKRDPRLFFILCGAPPPGEGPALRERYAAELAGIGRVMPWIRDVPTLLSALDLLIHPAADEAFGRVPVEAMACGVPVIAAGAGGAAETVVDGETGLLIPPGNTAALSAAILALAGDPSRRRAMGAAGRQRAESHYSSTLHARRVEQLYRVVIG